jgi:hypothetical protein
MSNFMIEPLDVAIVTDAERRRAFGDPTVVERIADAPTGFPCRLSLTEVPPGTRLLLFRHRPFSGNGPYAEEGPIFAQPDAVRAEIPKNEVPPFIRSRPFVVVRRYDATEAIVGSELAPGADCAAAISRAFDIGDTAFVHVRSATYGCFLFRAGRA